MKPNITLAETKTPNGARMTLVEHDGSYCIRVNGQQLMHSSVSTSEIELGKLGCERHPNRGAATRVLIGGLGLGFTLQSVLQCTGPKAVVHVAELFPEIVAWNRTHLAGLNGKLLTDKRVTVLTGDVRPIIKRASRAPYDVIVATGSLPIVPSALRKQLKIGGRLAAVVGTDPVMSAEIITRVSETGFDTVKLFETRLAPLRNAERPSSFRF